MDIAEGAGFTWSPDSSRLAYVRSTYDHDVPSRYRNDLYVAAPFSPPDSPKRIARDAWWAAWSPDGSMIAFERFAQSPYPCKSELFVVAARGGAPRRIVGCQRGNR
jgi:hypothetical protein